MGIKTLVQFSFVLRGQTYMYATRDEAEKMARWMGVAVSTIKEVHIR